MTKCKQCASLMVPSKVPNFGAAEAQYAVGVFDMPGLTCPKGHERAFAYSGFAEDLLVELLKRVPRMVEKGLVGKRRLCCRCIGPMDDATPGDGRLSIQISLRDLDAFRVELAGLLWRCSSCQQPQVIMNRKLKFEIPEALMKGFESIKIQN